LSGPHNIRRMKETAPPRPIWAANRAAESSLSEVHRQYRHSPRGIFLPRKLAAFSGPGFLVAVGYMDGAPVIGRPICRAAPSIRLSSPERHPDFQFMAILLQHLCPSSSAVRPRDATWPSACRGPLSDAGASGFSGFCAEIAIAACDLAEVRRFGDRPSASLRHPPRWSGAALHYVRDVLAVLYLPKQGVAVTSRRSSSLDRPIGTCFAGRALLSQARA